MKRILFTTLFVCCTVYAFTQGLAVNTTGAAADGSALLDVSSATRGALFPRMTLLQRTAIATPATGLLVYQTDGLNGFYYNAGTPAVPNWVRLTAENHWTLNGTHIYNNNTGNVGIGTTIPAAKLDVTGTVNVNGTQWTSHFNYGANEDLYLRGGRAGANVYINDIAGLGIVHIGSRLGIGTTTPNALLQFPNNVLNRKIVLYEHVNDDHQFYGFGVNSGVLRYQTATVNDDHVFYSGTAVPSSTELMRIRGNGNVGIGTGAPAERLHVNGRVRITDGTQGANKILTSDANGTASWVTDNTVQSVRTGSFGGGVNFDYNEMGTFPTGGTSKYTTVSITLPPGRWVVFAHLLINGTTLPAGGGIFIRTCLSESAVVGTCSSDIVAGTGSLISGNFSYSNTFSFVSGQVFINNATAGNKTYYLWASAAKNGSAPASGLGIGAIGSSFWGENQLFAIPMN